MGNPAGLAQRRGGHERRRLALGGAELMVTGVFGVALAVVLILVTGLGFASRFHQRQMRTLRASVVILKVSVAD